MRLILGMAALLFPWGAGAGLCDGGDANLIYARCDGGARVEALLLPEDWAATPQDALDITAAYTATDRRADGSPKPVGLFLRDGAIISREFVRFDGVLVVDRDGKASIHHRARVDLDGKRFNLNAVGPRGAFLSAAAAAGADVLQSHLLIVDGAVDTAPVAGAPVFRRRILFQTADGALGVYDSGMEAMTLDAAAKAVAARYQPAMALNLDMGSYDFCRKGADLCGMLRPADVGKLSNLLRLR